MIGHSNVTLGPDTPHYSTEFTCSNCIAMYATFRGLKTSRVAKIIQLCNFIVGLLSVWSCYFEQNADIYIHFSSQNRSTCFTQRRWTDGCAELEMQLPALRKRSLLWNASLWNWPKMFTALLNPFFIALVQAFSARCRLKITQFRRLLLCFDAFLYAHRPLGCPRAGLSGGKVT